MEKMRGNIDLTTHTLRQAFIQGILSLETSAMFVFHYSCVEFINIFEWRIARVLFQIYEMTTSRCKCCRQNVDMDTDGVMPLDGLHYFNNGLDGSGQGWSVFTWLNRIEVKYAFLIISLSSRCGNILGLISEASGDMQHILRVDKSGIFTILWLNSQAKQK